MKPLTITQLRRQVMQAYQEMICERLGYRPEDIATMQYEQGTLFAEIYFQHVPEMGRMMLRDRTYWNWWRSHWHERDVEFLADPEIEGCGVDLQRMMYTALNSGEQLQAMLKLSRVVYVSVLPMLKRRA